MQVDRCEYKHCGNDGESSGQLYHGCKVSGSLTEGIAGSDYAGGIIDCGSGPQTICRIGKPQPLTKEREYNDHNRVKEEGGRHSVSNIQIVRFDDRCDRRDGRSAAYACSRIDQTACLPVQLQCFSDECTDAEAGEQGEDHHSEGKLPYGQHRADIQAGTQQNDRKFQELL